MGETAIMEVLLYRIVPGQLSQKINSARGTVAARFVRTLPQTRNSRFRNSSQLTLPCADQ
jgi:hypothetical protein